MEKFVKDKRKCFYIKKKEGDYIMNLTMDMLEDYNMKNEFKNNNFISTFLTLILKFKIGKMDFSRYIIVDKNIMSGLPVIKGTRITVKSIYESYILHLDKYSNRKNVVKAIKKDYPSLSEEQILFALCYYIKKTSIFKLCSYENLNR